MRSNGIYENVEFFLQIEKSFKIVSKENGL